MFRRERCDLCGDCVFHCPYVDYGREQSIEQFRRLVEGETPESVSQCVTCVACNQFCEKGANPFDLILERQEETGVLGIPETNTQLFRNLPQAPSEVVEGEPGRAVISLCSVGDLLPGLFEGELFEGCTFLKGGRYFCNVGWIHLGHHSPVREGALHGGFVTIRVHLPEDCSQPVPAVITLDGASPGMGIMHRLGEVGRTMEEILERVRIGMRVQAVWKPAGEREGAITDILYFRPLGS